MRLLGSGSVVFGYDPWDFLSLKINAFARLPADFYFKSSPILAGRAEKGFVALSDSYIKINSDDASLSLGFLYVPWSRTRSALVLNRLNPVDYRRGPDFSADALSYMPQWGSYFQTYLYETIIDLAMMVHYSPSKGSLAASEQGGVQIAQYQGALFSNLEQMKSFMHDSRVALTKPVDLVSPAFALRLKRRLGDIFDASIFGYWGFSSVPFIRSTRRTIDEISYKRQAGFGFDVSANLGGVVLKGEFLAEPSMNNWGGKTTVLLEKSGVFQSEQFTALTFAVAADAEYGDWFSGSLELIDTIWLNVPQDKLIWGVESLRANLGSGRAVHRLALALTSKSYFFKKWLALQVKGEFGLTQPDILAHVSLAHPFDDLGLEVGVYSNLFFGIQGSPGWLRREATNFGLFVQYKI